MPSWVVYRMYDREGVLLYIGRTGDLRQRLMAHRRQKPWFGQVWELRIEPFATWGESRRAELSAIYAEGARHNVTPRDNARNGHKTRAQTKDRLHAQGRHCQDASCRSCPEDRAAS